MRYRLCDNYQLAGWRNLPTGVYNTVLEDWDFFSVSEYRLLLHMNGIDDIPREALSDKELEFINRLLEQGVIQICSVEKPLLLEQKYKYHDRTYIAHVHWAITGKCNYRCKHCFMYSPLAKFPEPPMEECRRIIESMQDAGVSSISLTGGEPLVRADFLELVDELVEHGIKVSSIYTNGALVTDQLLDELAIRGQKPKFHISYDGAQYHDWLRGVSGARDRAVNAINICRKHGNEIYAAMCVHKKNKDEIFETVSFLATSGVSRTRIKFMLPNGMWADKYASESLKMEEAVNSTVKFIDEFFSLGIPSHSVIVDRMLFYKKESKYCDIPFIKRCNDNTYLCRNAAVNPFIGPTGVVLPCMTLGGCDFQDNFPSVLEKPLAEIMSDSYYRDVTHMKKKDYFETHEECRSCEERSICTTGCRACTTGNYLNQDQWNCQFLKGGYYHRIDEAIRNALKKYGLENEVEYPCFIK